MTTATNNRPVLNNSILNNDNTSKETFLQRLEKIPPNPVKLSQVPETKQFVKGYGWNVVRRNPDALFIGIAGIIGAGKTTFCNRLSSILGIPCQEESVETNPYLSSFYKDKEKYGFAMQIHLLNKRFEQHQQIIWGGKGAIQDRTAYEDPIFAKMLHETGMISDLDYKTYMSLFQNMLHFMRKPDIIIYLDVDTKTALNRIQERGRDCEKSMPESYLIDLKRHYEDWCTEASSNTPIIKMDWNTNLSNPADYAKTADAIALEIISICDEYRFGKTAGILFRADISTKPSFRLTLERVGGSKVLHYSSVHEAENPKEVKKGEFNSPKRSAVKSDDEVKPQTDLGFMDKIRIISENKVIIGGDY